MTNPTEKGSTGHPPTAGVTNHAPQDEPWIRDVQAATLMVDLNPEHLGALCEGEVFFCEYCGAKFPIWPIQKYSAHAVAEHGKDLTLQMNQSILMGCTAGLTETGKIWLSVQICNRVNLRRRARDLGLITFCDAQGNPLPKDPKRILM